jgi:hypothetical protein
MAGAWKSELWLRTKFENSRGVFCVGRCSPPFALGFSQGPMAPCRRAFSLENSRAIPTSRDIEYPREQFRLLY